MKWLTRRRLPLGYVDSVADRIVRGWAWLPSNPHSHVQLDFFFRDVFLGQTGTGVFRPDLQIKKIGDGRHGFVFHLPDDVESQGIDRADLTVVAWGPAPTVLPNSGVSANDRQPAPRFRPQGAESYFRAYLATLLTKSDSESIASETGLRTKIDAICARTRDGEASAFVQHIALKYGRPGPAEGDPSAFWIWYLGNYGLERGPFRAPLSSGDISGLMQRDPKGRPLVAGLFEDASDVRLSHAEYHYRWAIEESRRLFVEDCLVPRAYVDALRGVHPSKHQDAFPLSVFMQMLHERHPVLNQLATSNEESRKIIYVLIMLMGLRSPHYLVYLPERWLLEILTPASAASPFEQILTYLFGASNAISASRYRELIAVIGFDIASQTISGTRYREHRVLGGSMTAVRRTPVDVQIIGPLRSNSGLGESCRRIADALRETQFSVNAVHYDRGHATSNSHEEFGRLQAARLNILHVNAEEIPEVYAYLADVFSQSRTVAVPYWELSHPVAAHRLGLQIVDELWVASTFLTDVFGASGCPVKWVGMSHGAASDVTREEGLALRAQYGIRDETFLFLTTSDALSWVQRKNPLAAIEAFQLAFSEGENAALVVKTRNLNGPLSETQQRAWRDVQALSKPDPRIVLIDETFENRRHRALLAGCDSFVSLHRAEGLGLDLLDAMALGIPLIATAYSGNMDFCSDETAWLVDFDLQPVPAGEYGFVEPGHVWAYPHLQSAAAAMRSVFGDPDRSRAQHGQALLRMRASTAALCTRLAERIDEILR